MRGFSCSTSSTKEPNTLANGSSPLSCLGFWDMVKRGGLLYNVAIESKRDASNILHYMLMLAWGERETMKTILLRAMTNSRKKCAWFWDNI